METTLEIALPVFGLVICGYLVGRSRIMDEAGIDGLTNFVFYVAIPVLLFRTVMRSAVPEAGDLAILTAYFGGCFITFILAYAVGNNRQFEPAIRFEYGLLFPTGVTCSQITREFIETLKASVANIDAGSTSIAYSGLG